MHIHDAIKALRAAGVTADAVGPRTIRADDTDLAVFTPRAAPTRADTERALAQVEPGGGVLIVADRLTPSLSLAALENNRIAVVAKRTVIWNRTMMKLDTPSRPAQKVSSGRRPYGRYAVARALLAASEPVTQQQIVRDAGIAQGGVSRVLSSDLFTGLIDQTWGKIQVSDRALLFDRVVDRYPGPGGVATYWWHEKSILEQATLVAGADETALISGDVAADRISAWRRPEHAVVYTRSEPDLRHKGFALADPDDYTLMLIHAEDHTIWSTAKAWSGEQITDPVIAAYDVIRTGTYGDEREAASHLRSMVVNRK